MKYVIEDRGVTNSENDKDRRKAIRSFFHMEVFGLAADRVMARIRQDGRSVSIPSLSRSLLIGGLGFCLASLCVFATVAFAERWMYRNLGLAGSYIVWTILFILLGGALLSPLVIGPGRLRRFQLLFGAAFLLYAAGWVGSYFTLRRFTGELVGSIVGSILMALVVSLAFGVIKTFFTQAATLFIANSAGYFLGDAIHGSIHGEIGGEIGGKIGMLLWGVIYGLFMGAGLGLSIFLAQKPLREKLNNPKSETELA